MSFKNKTKVHPIPKSVSFNSEDEVENYDFSAVAGPVVKEIELETRAAKKPLPKINNRGSKTGTKQPGLKAKKSLKETQRDKVLRQSQLFHAKKLKSLLPDPDEVRKAEAEVRRLDKMKEAVREALDILMPSIVTEVSLKLGGAMYAQENAIKNIVDDYIKVNPIIENKSENMMEDIKTLLVEKLSEEALKMREEIPVEVMQKVEEEKLAAVKNDMEQIEGRIDTVRRGLNIQTTVADQQKEELVNLESKVAALTADLAVSCSSARVNAEEGSKQFTKDNVAAIKKKFDGMKDKQKTIEKNVKELQNKLENVKVSGSTDGEKIAALQASIEELKSKKKGCCCTVM